MFAYSRTKIRRQERKGKGKCRAGPKTTAAAKRRQPFGTRRVSVGGRLNRFIKASRRGDADLEVLAQGLGIRLMPSGSKITRPKQTREERIQSAVDALDRLGER